MMDISRLPAKFQFKRLICSTSNVFQNENISRLYDGFIYLDFLRSNLSFSDSAETERIGRQFLTLLISVLKLILMNSSS